MGPRPGLGILNQPVLVDLSDSRYSVRNTRIGSVRIARIAGIYIAISETAASRIAEIPNTVESNRWSGSGELASNRLSSNKAGSARAIPLIYSNRDIPDGPQKNQAKNLRSTRAQHHFDPKLTRPLTHR
jgi:hypothetical protein